MPFRSSGVAVAAAGERSPLFWFRSDLDTEKLSQIYDDVANTSPTRTTDPGVDNATLPLDVARKANINGQ